MFTSSEKSQDQFDQIIVNRLFSADFAQPKVNDQIFYRTKAVSQILYAVKAIKAATNQHEFTTAIAQANAFIDAAIDFEFIDISEKVKWLDEIAAAVRLQTIGDSA
ncbi:hypothetical protein AY606_05890 [Acinetobacter sp. SFB]|uniref:hypothetical protein n=1 Tax=Acinetobacter sp. SFB TaxID=1805634 RepID=UPI0007D7DF37|nr:hypothetical protein [Acinetobacter sp. SFB]OAL78957.1 hypothetical protein AY606_05890 [Acinetobacter sp. SFB]